ncbi:structural maintenance of chromosomes protein 4 [Physcomitrium patens]|uniref:Structural maintenance of chromosomes protein n=1 Tax=Physcomitrium patens TaxID=3218 RepID=A0A2K1J1B5_PHYPA|nr:structural maintenance of chromosomes protein 4-like [Physcomitrium patens]PNR35313.1 hypothetical protein PHYPA_023213 [Physcomitrium patens]|eukprot:XP_024402503.1 structural maintenance of chromosomes protein 4-like [Physcomitrella patens]
MGREVEIAGHNPSPGGRGKPRLFIKKMVLENFKSYAGKQYIGPFHKCFSAVVGPNGSGKSNVIDAMLFVFGKRAKQMRLNKVSELIHNSTNHQNLDKASVSVHFQEIIDLENDNYEVVPDSDFVLTRVAFRDNSSKYYLDSRMSTFTEVTQILMAKGVDLEHNRFLILQGEVEQISLMKPKAQTPHDEGFLEYLEDIIGSNKYVERIDASSKQLEELTEKKDSMVQRVKVAEKEKGGLEGAKNEAEQYMLKEAELIKWKRHAAGLTLKEADAEAEELKKKVTELENALKQERETYASHSAEIKELEMKLKKQTKHHEGIEGDLKSCSDQFKSFERQDLKYQEDLKHVKQKLKKLEDKIVKDTAKIEEVEKETAESTVLIPKMEAEVARLTEQLGEEEKTLEALQEGCKGEIEMYHKLLNTARLELEPWEKHIIECESKIGVTSAASKLLKDKHEAGRKAYDAAVEKIQETKLEINKKEDDLVRLMTELARFQTSLNTAKEEEQVASKAEESLQAQEQALQQKVGEMRAVVDTEKNQGSVVKAILQARESGQIQGIHGRLGDLGAIDAKYDVAISTACGGLDFIVVETTNSAQACVELLRTKQLGVATFLILDKQSGLIQRMNQEVVTPENVPRLFDLVTVRDERLRLAFYSQLGNTVVAKNLDQATRIAYGPAVEFRRVVSLDGAVFEKSGTMSGGGGKPRGGRMGTAIKDSTVSRESMASAEKDLEDVRAELSATRQRVSEAAQQHQSALKSVSQLELDIAKIKMELEALKGQQSDISKQLEALKTDAVPNKEELDEIQTLDEEVAQGESLLADLNKKSSKLRAKSQDLQNKMENAGGDELKQKKALVGKLQTDINKTSTEINKRQVLISTSSKTIEKLRKSIEDSIKDKEKFIQDKEAIQGEFKNVEAKAFVIQEKFTQLQEALSKDTVELEVIKKKYMERQKVINELRAVELDAEFKLKDIKETARLWEGKAEALKREYKELSKKLQDQIEQVQKEGIDLALLEVSIKEPSSEISLARAKESVKVLEGEIKNMQPSLDSIAEYRRKAAMYDERIRELNQVSEAAAEIKKSHDDLRKRRLDEFMGGFNSISMKLKEMYQMITLGGDAELELVDSLDPFAEGVVFTVRPPKKSWKAIANLSGGEKTLSSLALVFALHHYKPTPLYVMDEIDAALDFKNVSIVGHYIKERTKDAQFVIISLRNNMFELADYLIGIYKTDNCTKSITINPHSFLVPVTSDEKRETQSPENSAGEVMSPC